jgi:hypothetical protein
VVLVDSRSHSFVREGNHCEFLLTSFDSSWGVLENPRHSLPPNTTCRYQFQGRRHETVWLSFVKYHAASADPASYELGAECNARLRIWDGRIATNTGSPRQQVSDACAELDTSRCHSCTSVVCMLLCICFVCGIFRSVNTTTFNSNKTKWTLLCQHSLLLRSW